LNEPFNLLSGLVGNVDFGGSWINPSSVTLSSSIDTAGNTGGQFDYLYVVSNGVCPNDTAIVSVNVNSGCDYNVGLTELENFVNVYPNPTNGLITIHVTKHIENGFIQIEDINGKIVRNISNLNQGENSIDLSQTMNGMYLVRINIDSGEYITRIVKN
jgi:hypothetical protein